MAHDSDDPKGSGEQTPEPVDEPARPRLTVRRSVAAGALLLIVVLAAGAGYEGWLLWRQHQRDVATTQAVEAARTYAVTLTTTDQNAIDQNFAEILDGATGEFKETYTKASAQMRKMLIDNKVSTTGTVLDAGVKHSSPNSVDVLVSVKQTVTSAEAPEERTDYLVVSLTMQEEDGRWLAANVVVGQ